MDLWENKAACGGLSSRKCSPGRSHTKPRTKPRLDNERHITLLDWKRSLQDQKHARCPPCALWLVQPAKHRPRKAGAEACQPTGLPAYFMTFVRCASNQSAQCASSAAMFFQPCAAPGFLINLAAAPAFCMASTKLDD